MSDRIILIRIQGLGSLLTNAQMVFTSRGTLPYLNGIATLAGVVSDLGDQFSSEIGFFESMGSDPSTSFSVISTAETRSALLDRRKVAVLDANGAPVVTTSYIDAGYNVTFTVSDTSSMFPGQLIRIGTIAFEVIAVNSATEVACSRRWGSPLIPIPMILAGEEAAGMVVYDLFLSTGSVEMLPLVVSTAEVTATSEAEEEVIFRGVVTRVGVETSRGASNQITVQCGSLMGYLRNAPFRPTVGFNSEVKQIGHWTYREDLGEDGLELSEAPVTIFTTEFNTGVCGTPSVTNEPHTTSMRALQIRDGGVGGAAAFSTIDEPPYFALTIDGQIATAVYANNPDRDTRSAQGARQMLYTFDSSFYAYGASFDVGQQLVSGTRDEQQNGGGFYGYRIGTVAGMAEVSFVCSADTTPLQMLQDLLFGTVDGVQDAWGYRGAMEAAWLPIQRSQDFSELVDLASLEALLQGRDDVFPPPGTFRPFRPLPYDAGGAKTVGDVLSLILKRLGGFMVYDRGKLRFGSWAVNNPIPTVVDDGPNNEALAEPAISIDFDRTACLQSVEVQIGVHRMVGEATTVEARGKITRSVTNLDLGAAGLGKTTQMGSFQSLPNRHRDSEFTGTSWFATANQAIVRYSQPAAKVVVTYRDAISDLVVGETVAFSTAYLPSASGEMGIALATGIVLKAARSWKTPTTEYSLLLFGYVGASASKVPLIGASARCTGVVTGNDVKVEPVWFTRGSSATGGAPASDVAAFGQTALLAGSDFVIVSLLDANGTEVGGGADLAKPRPLTNELRFTGPPFLGTPILPGYVITLANAGSGLQGWDAFQAGADGTIAGRPGDASPWVT
jgi:hypothetical protein